MTVSHLQWSAGKELGNNEALLGRARLEISWAVHSPE